MCCSMEIPYWSLQGERNAAWAHKQRTSADSCHAVRTASLLLLMCCIAQSWCNACGACRGTYLGAAWSEFSQVREVWKEVFAGKPYTTHTLAISGGSAILLLLGFLLPCLALFV